MHHCHQVQNSKRIERSDPKVKDGYQEPVHGEPDYRYVSSYRWDVPAIEGAVYSPDAYVERIKRSGIIWIHKAAIIEHLKRVEKLGTDTVVLVGLEGYGFKNVKQLPVITSIAWGSR